MALTGQLISGGVIVKSSSMLARHQDEGIEAEVNIRKRSTLGGGVATPSGGVS